MDVCVLGVIELFGNVFIMKIILSTAAADCYICARVLGISYLKKNENVTFIICVQWTMNSYHIHLQIFTAYTIGTTPFETWNWRDLFSLRRRQQQCGQEHKLATCAVYCTNDNLYLLSLVCFFLTRVVNIVGANLHKLCCTLCTASSSVFMSV